MKFTNYSIKINPSMFKPINWQIVWVPNRRKSETIICHTHVSIHKPVVCFVDNVFF